MKRSFNAIGAAKRIVSLLITVFLLPFFSFVETAAANRSGKSGEVEPKRERIIVSLGDSYSSGEGVEKFYGQHPDLEVKIDDPDWLGHRSTKSWPGKLKMDGVDGIMADHRGENWFFAASTGATTGDIWGYQIVKICRQKPFLERDMYGDWTFLIENDGTVSEDEIKRGVLERGAKSFTSDGEYFSVKVDFLKGNSVFTYLKEKRCRIVGFMDGAKTTLLKLQEPQIAVFDRPELAGKTIDYVTMTIGGNDADFGGIVETAANPLSFPNALHDKLEKTWDLFYNGGRREKDVNIRSIRENLMDVYKGVYEKTDGKAAIIVAGYPQLFNADGSPLGFWISKDEATLINRNTHLFNEAIRNAVNECRGNGVDVHFVSVEEVFQGHGAYSSTPYIREIVFKHSTEDFDMTSLASQYSVHPNETGTDKYAECVNETIEYLDYQKKTNSGTDSRFTQIENPGERDIVMVLDTSGSMDGTPLEKTKEAALSFIYTASKEGVEVGVVTYNDYASDICYFTGDRTLLSDAVNRIYAGGMTNIDAGLQNADSMLYSQGAAADKKIILLMSDGAANEGRTGSDLIDYANELKNRGIMIYTLGFFDALDSVDKMACQDVMERIASPGCHYEVDDPENLVYFFGDIAEQVNGQKYIYIRIACPVDVTVSFDGETLSSAWDSFNTRTSFGTLSFEETETQATEYYDYGYYDGGGDQVKILRLKEGVNYDVRINGTGEGTMDYKVGFMDENGEYSDYREFNDVEVTPETQIYSMTSVSDTTVLNVDKDGDGKFELSYEAGKNETGKAVEIEEVNEPRIAVVFFTVLAAVALMTTVILTVKICLERKERRRESAAAREP